MNYELTDETIEHASITLHRTHALVDMPQHGVGPGDLGGFIEKVENLTGNAWVSGIEPTPPEVKEDSVEAPDDPFVAWLNEFEGYGMRIERLSEDLRDPLDKLMPWLRAAYEVGLNAKK